MERDLYHGHFCYDNEHQFHFEVICAPLMETFHQKIFFVIYAFPYVV